jgi:hypothetical protein
MLQKIISWLPGAILGALAFLAGVGPKEAASHLSEWASIVGVENVPPWLASKSADMWGLGIGLVGLVIWAAFKWGPGLWTRIHSDAARPDVSAKGSTATLRIKYTDEAANRRYMRFAGDGGACTWYLEIVNESHDIDAQDVEIKVESYDQIPDLLSPHTRTGAFTPVGIILAFERGGNTRSIRRQDSEWVKFLAFDRQIPRRWIQIGEYEQGPHDLHGKIMSVYTPHRIELTVRAANANKITASFFVKADSEMLEVRQL